MKRNVKQRAAGLLAAALLAACLPLGAFAEGAAPATPAPETAATAETAAESPDPTPAPAESPAAATAAPVLLAEEPPQAASFIVFDFHDGGTDPETISAEQIAAMTELPTRPHTLHEDYVFAGWYAEPDGAGEQLTLEKAKANKGQLTVYAKWTTDASGTRTVRTEPLDCTDTESVKTDMENAAQGWAWNKATKTLTLDNATFYVAETSFADSDYPDPAITVPGGATIVVKPGTVSWVHAAAEAIWASGALTVQGGGTGTLALEGGAYPLDAFCGLFTSHDLTVDGALLSVEGSSAGVSVGRDLRLQNGAVVSSFGENIGVQSDRNITVADSRLVGGIKAVLEPTPEPAPEPQPEPEGEGTGVGVYAEGSLTLQNNGEVSGYGDAYAIAAVGCLFAETGIVTDGAANTPDGFVSGQTKTITQTTPGTPATLQQDSRTLYFYPQDGKMYDALKSEGGREITLLTGWQAEQNAAGTYDLLLENFNFSTTAATALRIMADCTVKLRGENTLCALAQGAGGAAGKDSTALEAWYDLSITNDDDPCAVLQLISWNVDGSSVTDPEAFVGSNGLNVGGNLTATDVTLDVLSRDAVGPKLDGAEVESTGITCGGDLTMTNVTLTVNTGDVTDGGDNGMGCISRGIEALGSVTLNQCQTEIRPGKAGRSEGIYRYETGRGDHDHAPETLTVNGGKLSVFTESATVYTVGLAFFNVTITNGADVVAMVGQSRDFSHGVFTRNLMVDGARLYAFGRMGGIRLGSSCTLKNVVAKGAATGEDDCSLPAEWKRSAEENRGSVFTLVGSGTVCNQVLIDATAPAPTSTPAPAHGSGSSEPTPAPTAVPDISASTFRVNAWVTAGGSISAGGVTGYKGGSKITYTITPAPGYRIVKVLVDGVDVGALSSYTFDYLNRDHEIAAYFDKATTTAATANRSTIPQTADEAPLLLWLALLSTAAATLIALLTSPLKAPSEEGAGREAD